MDKHEEVKQFLQAVKETITNPVFGEGWVLIRRQQNQDCLLKLGFKYGDIKGTLLSLSVEDFCEGPCRDRDQPGELWIFGKTIENNVIYIKLKLACFGSLKKVRVISFHFAESTLNYPFREEKKEDECDDEND